MCRLVLFIPCPTKKQCKQDFWPQNDQIWPKIGIFGLLSQALPAHLVPCWWVGWWLWCAGCISQDTYLLYDDDDDNEDGDDVANR